MSRDEELAAILRALYKAQYPDFEDVGQSLADMKWICNFPGGGTDGPVAAEIRFMRMAKAMLAIRGGKR